MESILLGGGTRNGESCVIHLEDGDVGIIDSFNNSRGEPIGVQYLKVNEIAPSRVKFILITHLHKDHIEGITRLSDYCPDADIIMSAINALKSFSILVSMSNHDNLNLVGMKKIRFLYKHFKSKGRYIVGAKEGTCIYKSSNIEITSLYPNKRAIDKYDKVFQELVHDALKESKKQNRINKKLVKPRSINNSFNAQCVVLSLVSSELNIFYGGDLEYEKDQAFGLGYVFNKLKPTEVKFDVIKAPHHGSKTSYNKADWTTLLKPLNFIKMTSWASSLKNYLPKNDIWK